MLRGSDAPGANNDATTPDTAIALKKVAQNFRISFRR
jgi:hypothetical protein